MDENTRKKRIGNNLQQFFGGFDVKWFMCFGTLLNLVRHPQKFDLDSDIDIGIIGSDLELFYDQIKNTYTVSHFMKSDDTGKLLNFCYYDGSNDIHIDVFKWMKFKGMYWHTYDVLNDADEKGCPSKYHFKSMPTEVFERDEKDIQLKRQDLRYGRIMTKHGTWLKPIPELPAEGIELPIPSFYGLFLDIAYPEWATTREGFGVSEAFSTFKTKSCKDLC